jgi:hypothetical protein
MVDEARIQLLRLIKKGKNMKTVTLKNYKEILGELSSLEKKINSFIEKLEDKEEKKVIDFKAWLEDQDIDSNMFWKKCKRKNQGWSDKNSFYSRKDFKNIEVGDWIINAFNWRSNMLNSSMLLSGAETFDIFNKLSIDWNKVLVDNPDAIVELGFRK